VETKLEKKAKNQIGVERINGIIKEIQGLTGYQRNNLCFECHRQKGCGTDHSTNLYDTGVCDLCGETNDVVNCSIAKHITDRGINEIVYLESGLSRIFRQSID